MLGNLIQQSARTQNPHLVSIGAEGWRGAAHELLMAHNTLIDDSGQDILLRVSVGMPAGRVVLANRGGSASSNTNPAQTSGSAAGWVRGAYEICSTNSRPQA